MGDVVAVVGTVAFFLLATSYASWCRPIVGSAAPAAADDEVTS